MWPLVPYSNFFEIVSTVAFLVLQTRLILCMFVFNTVLATVSLYTINNDYTRCIIFTASGFLDIRISTCPKNA